jgi:uncharacterized peroxidase-related enzyme
MAFVQPTPEQEACETATATFDRDRATWGFLPNYARTFALRPEAYRAWQQLNATIKSTMDQRRYELATVAAAAALRSSYCTLAHGRVLAEHFLPAEDVVRLVADRATAPLDPVEHAVVAFAEKVALHADRITEDEVDGLRAVGLTDEEIFDVVLAAAARCFFAKTLDATGTAADAVFREMPPDLVDVLTVGRAVADPPDVGVETR